MDVYGENGEVVDDGQILGNLLEIVKCSSQRAEPVGILTTENRNGWGSAYLKLKKGKILQFYNYI